MDRLFICHEDIYIKPNYYGSFLKVPKQVEFYNRDLCIMCTLRNFHARKARFGLAMLIADSRGFGSIVKQDKAPFLVSEIRFKIQKTS